MITTTDPGLAAAALRDGRLAVLPTETVYGLGGRADLPQAVARIYATKNRPADHPLIVHVADAAALSVWGQDVRPYAVQLADAFWPGPLTLVVARTARAGSFITGGQGTVALRVPSHQLMRAALVELGALMEDPAVGIAAPSANRFGRVSPTTVAHVLEEIGDLLADDDVVLDGGPSSVGVESTIVDCTGPLPAILRTGEVSAADVTLVTGLKAEGASSVRAPGTLASHYAPQARVSVVSEEALAAISAGDATVGVLALAHISTPVGLVRLAEPENATEYARVLYAALREADALALTEVLAVPPPREGVGAAVLDRLTRAAT